MRLKTAATKIRIENGRAGGVETQSGDLVRGTRAIVSNISAIETFNRLVGREHLPSKLLARLDGMEPSLSDFMVFVGLDEGFKTEDPEEYIVQISDTYDHNEAYRFACDGDSGKAGFGIGIHSNPDRSRARGAATSATIFQLQSYEPWRRFEADYAAGNKPRYEEEKERVAAAGEIYRQ